MEKENILESSLTEHEKTEIKEKFNEAVSAKVEDIISNEKDKITEELKLNYEFKLDEATKQNEQDLIKVFERKLAIFESTITETLDKYCEQATTEIVDEIKDSLHSELLDSEYQCIMESFKLNLINAGVDIGMIEKNIINESKNSNENLIRKYNKLHEKYLELEQKLLEEQKKNALYENDKGFSLLESDNFRKMAKLVESNDIDDYRNKLTSLKHNFSKSLNENSRNDRVERIKSRSDERFKSKFEKDDINESFSDERFKSRKTYENNSNFTFEKFI